MEELQHRQPHSLYGATGVTNLHDMNYVTTLNDNAMWVERRRGRTSPYCSHYEPYPRKERRHSTEMESESSPPHKSWWKDNEMKRKRRVAKYKLYAAEGRLKTSLKKGFRSFKKLVATI
ncbi:hypothetical protein SESBI_41573 [Sesbania bispinosa]|nr:hypothetical protein SESBI_41573 [Sesbania bispinosa]